VNALEDEEDEKKQEFLMCITSTPGKLLYPNKAKSMAVMI
jgi:hypothetical protein